MDRKTAETILERIKAWEAVFGDLHEISLRVDDHEGRQLRRVIGDLVLDIHQGITLPIVAQYPDLHPDRDDLD